MASLTLLYPVCVSVVGVAAVSVDAHHFLYAVDLLEAVHDEFDITTVVDAKLYRTFEDALVGGDSDAVDVDVELVGDDLGHIEYHTLAVDPLDFDSRGQYILAFCFQEGLGGRPERRRGCPLVSARCRTGRERCSVQSGHLL